MASRLFKVLIEESEKSGF
ncbi:hypothetical protein [Lysinibacillus fusiformis]